MPLVKLSTSGVAVLAAGALLLGGPAAAESSIRSATTFQVAENGHGHGRHADRRGEREHCDRGGRGGQSGASSRRSHRSQDSRGSNRSYAAQGERNRGARDAQRRDSGQVRERERRRQATNGRSGSHYERRNYDHRGAERGRREAQRGYAARGGAYDRGRYSTRGYSERRHERRDYDHRRRGYYGDTGRHRRHGYYDRDRRFHYYAGFSPIGWVFAYHPGYYVPYGCRTVERVVYRYADRIVYGAVQCWDEWGMPYIVPGSQYVYRTY